MDNFTNTKKYVICILVIISIIFVYLGNCEKKANYKYKTTFGKIINKKVDITNVTLVEKQAHGVNVFSNQLKYRLEVTFEYKLKKKKYISSFYNNGITSDYIKKQLIQKYWNLYQKNKKIVVYYNINNNADCGINLTYIKKRNAKLYYLFSIITICTLLYFLFFSDFFINE